ncbi:MAG: DNA-binding protein [Duganella sp.]
MASEGVTVDQVAAAADSLQNDGQPVTIDTVSGALGVAPSIALHKHLAAWRTTQARAQAAPPAPALPPALLDALTNWAQQYSDETGAASRTGLAETGSDMDALVAASEQLEADRAEALDILAERDEQIERLQAELRNARQIATDALVGKAKDHLAIEGKDSQLADLRQQLERNVTAAAADSDRRLAAEMELVGAITARDNFAAEIQELRARLDARQPRSLS